jgi:hypothetical protein
MTNSELNAHIGQRVNIVNGKYELTDDGAFIISKTFGPERVWMTNEGKSQCITTKPFIGRVYKLGNVDCVTLVCEYVQSKSLLDFYHSMSRTELLELQRSTVMSWLDEDSRFTSVGMDYEPGDCIVYAHTERMHANHIGIAYPDNKILHHLPGKLSCIDRANVDNILGGYRYNG